MPSLIGKGLNIKIDVEIGGVPMPVPSLETWKTIDTLVRSHFFDEPLPSEKPANDSASSFPSVDADDLEPQSRFSWTQKAWLALRRPVTVSEMYAVAMTQGYNPAAANPKLAFTKAVHNNPNLKKYARSPSGGYLYILSGHYTPPQNSNSHKPEAANIKASKVATTSKPKVPGIFDYAEKVLRKAGGPLSISGLVARMHEEGWKSTVDMTIAKQHHSIGSRLSTAKQRFTKRDGLWYLNEWLSGGQLNLTADDAGVQGRK